MKRFAVLAAFLLAVSAALADGYLNGGYSGGYQDKLSGYDNSIGGQESILIAFTENTRYAAPESLKVNGGRFDFVYGLTGGPYCAVGRFVDGDTTANNPANMRSYPARSRLAGTGVDWELTGGAAGSLTYMDIDQIDDFDGAEIISAAYREVVVNFADTPYVPSMGDTLCVVPVTRQDLQGWGDGWISNNINDAVMKRSPTVVEWPPSHKDSSTLMSEFGRWHDYQDLDDIVPPGMYTGTGYALNDTIAFDVTDYVTWLSENPSYDWNIVIKQVTTSPTFQQFGGPCVTNTEQRSAIIIEMIPNITTSSLKKTGGVPSGGRLEGGAIAHKENIYAIGGDVSGTFTSTDSGESWELHNNGLINHDEIPNYYVDDIVPVKNSYFEGFIAATRGGIYKASTSTGGVGRWVTMTPADNADSLYVSWIDRPWSPAGGRFSPTGFSSLSFASEDVVVASAGEYRWESGNDDDETLYRYPGGVVRCSHADSVITSLWVYDFSDATPLWEQLADYDEDQGRVVDVSAAYISGTLYSLCATTKLGPQLFSGGVYIDLSDNRWLGPAGEIFITWSDELLSSGDYQAIDSCYLTDDGRAFVALRNQEQASDVTSGMYMYDDVTSDAGSWYWIGDDSTLLAYSGKTIEDTGIGTGNIHPDAEFTYIQMAEGSSPTEPDTLFASSRDGASGAGLIRCLIPAVVTPADVVWTSLLWNEPGENLMPMDNWFDSNIAGTFNAHTIFEVALDPDDSQHMVLHTNIRLFGTTDGGVSWDRLDGVDYGNEEKFRSTGLDETCISGVGVGSDGTLYYSTADRGLITTDGDDWDWLILSNPGTDTDACPGSWSADWWNDTEFPNNESGDVIVFENFDGTGFDNVVIVGGEQVAAGQFNKIFGLTNGAWTHMTASVDSLDTYQFSGSTICGNADGTEVYVAYRKWEDSLCFSPGSLLRAGVIKFTYSSGWTHSFISADNDWPTSYNATSMALVGNDLFVSFPAYSGSTTGGVMYHDTKSGPGWTTCFGTPENDTYNANGNNTGLATDGTILYTITRGVNAGLFVCPDPAAAPATWTQLINAVAGTPLLPSITSVGPVLTERYPTLTTQQIAIALFNAAQLMVDPDDSDIVYFTVSGYENKMADFSGLYKYDDGSGTLEHLFPNDPSSSVGGVRGRMTYSDYFTPPRIVYGTSCSGPRWFNK